MPETGKSLFGSMLGDDEDARRLAGLLEGFYTAQVASVIARLGVPDLLAGGPRAAAGLARDAGADPGALSRVLAAAAVYGLVRHEEDGRYALTGTGQLLRTDVEGSARAVAAGFLGTPMWQCASRLGELTAGRVADPAAPGGIYEYYGTHPEEAQWFARAMGQATSILVSQLHAAAFRPLRSGRIVDVGGSRGTLLAYLLHADPAAAGVLFDRSEALMEAPAFLAEAGVSDRVETAAGNFLAGVPDGGDVYVLCQVLHNWDDEHVRAIVGNCHRASRPGGSLLVIEYVLPDGHEPSLSHVMDLIMMTTLGGRERTRSQHQALMAGCGYDLARDTPLDAVLPWRILEFTHRPT